MAQEETRRGQCLCGKTRFSVAADAAKKAGLCHCKMCRRWSGGLPLVAVQAKVTMESGDSVRWHRSSPWGMRGFCAECGTPLFWRAGENDMQWAVSVGALEDEGVSLTQHIFADDAPDWYALADNAPRYTGAEFVARTFSHLAAQFGDDFLKQAMADGRAHFGGEFMDEVKRRMDEAGGAENESKN